MSTISPSSTFLSKIFNDLSVKYTKELSKATVNQSKEVWIQGVSAEILKIILERAKTYNSQNYEALKEEDIMKLLNKLNYFYGLELKTRS